MKYLPLTIKLYPVIAIINPSGSSEHLLARIKQQDSTIVCTVHDSPADVSADSFVIAVTKNGELPDWWDAIQNDAILLSQQQADGLTPSQQSLLQADWYILRDLERMFLPHHPLRQQREQWRDQVDIEIDAAKDDPDES